MIARFDPSPAKDLRTKFHYFYSPYSPQVPTQKHMQFEDESVNALNARIQKMIASDATLRAETKALLEEY